MKNCKSTMCQKPLIFLIAAAIGISGVFGVSVPVHAQQPGTEAGDTAGTKNGVDFEAGEQLGTGEADGSGEQPGTGEADGSGGQSGTDEPGGSGGQAGTDEPGGSGGQAGTDEPDDSGAKDDGEAAAYTDQQGVIYTFAGKKNCYVSGFETNIASAIRIPEAVKANGGTYQVKGIRASAFKSCTALKRLEIPNSVTDIEADVFQGCKNLKSIVIVPVKYTVKTSGKTAAATVKIDGALLTTPADVKLELGPDVVKKSVSGKKTDGVTLQVFVRDNASYRVKDGLPEDITLAKKAVKLVADSGKSLKVRVKDAQGSSYYIKADAADLKQLSGDLSLSVKKEKADDTSGTLQTDLKKAIQKNKLGAGNVDILSYGFGKGTKANISIVFPVKNAKAGSEVYVYRYDKAKRVFAAVSFHPYTASKQGTVTLPISKGGTFLAVKKSLKYMSRKPASEFLREKGSTYYVDQKGNAVHGWKKIGSEYYYFDRDSGKMAAGGKVDGIAIRTDGTAKQTAAGVAKIQTMIKARAVVEKITKPSDSITVKREKCFRWVFQFPYRRYRRLKPIYKQPGWEVTFANDIFDHKQGCCVSEACAVAFLFHECGYKTVYVGIDTGHAWVELEGRVFDPLFAEGRGYSKYYNIPYSSYYMSKPVYKRKI